jgi:hypothetical protein
MTHFRSEQVQPSILRSAALSSPKLNLLINSRRNHCSDLRVLARYKRLQVRHKTFVNHLHHFSLASMGDVVLVVEKSDLQRVRHKTFVDHLHIVGLVNVGTNQLENLLLDGSKTVDLRHLGGNVACESHIVQDAKRPAPAILLIDLGRE